MILLGFPEAGTEQLSQPCYDPGVLETSEGISINQRALSLGGCGDRAGEGYKGHTPDVFSIKDPETSRSRDFEAKSNELSLPSFSLFLLPPSFLQY